MADLENWTREEFMAFTLLYAASADFEVSDDERQNIKQIAGEAEMAKAEANLSSLNDYKAIQAILGYKEQYYATEEDKDQLLFDLRVLFESDDEYEINEQNMMRALKKLL